MQISRGILSEISVQDTGRRSSDVCNPASVSVMQSERWRRDTGDKCTAGSRAHRAGDTAEVRGIQNHRLSEREAGIADVRPISEVAEAILGPARLVTRVLRKHSRIG